MDFGTATQNRGAHWHHTRGRDEHGHRQPATEWRAVEFLGDMELFQHGDDHCPVSRARRAGKLADFCRRCPVGENRPLKAAARGRWIGPRSACAARFAGMGVSPPGVRQWTPLRLFKCIQVDGKVPVELPLFHAWRRAATGRLLAPTVRLLGWNLLERLGLEDVGYGQGNGHLQAARFVVEECTGASS